MRSSDWSSDVCSSDLPHVPLDRGHGYAKTRRHILHLHTFHAPEQEYRPRFFGQFEQHGGRELKLLPVYKNVLRRKILLAVAILIEWFVKMIAVGNLLSQMIGQRSEEHTSELQSLMRISYAVFCLNNKQTTT